MIHGIINVYKEKGFTSHDVVAKLRGIVGQKKIGHTGTLDPDATGVLPVCLGKATKLCDLLTDKDKTYEAIIKGDNIPEPGIPESFKVLLKELQSLGLDVTVLDDEGNEVELMETSEYGNTDLNSIISGDKDFAFEDSESFSKMGFTKKEFDSENEELVDVEEEEDTDADDDSDFYDDMPEDGFEE